LDYSDFLQKFYLPKSGGGLEGYKSKCRTALFFFENGLDGKYDANIICPSDSTYEKWLTGTRRPESQIWSEAEKHLLTDHLLVKLMSVLNERNLRSMLKSFEVPLAIGESPDKRAFARAIAAQFEAIVHGCGSAENIVPAEYKKLPEPIGFKTYLRGAVERYKWIKLPGEEDCQLDEVYVCNNIGTSAAVFPHRIVGNVIENATLQKLRSYDRRGETKRILLVGGCGYGKTLMLQHLFLEAAEQTDETGCLPIFAELRNYSPAEQDLLSFIVATVQEYDDSFSTDSAKQLFRKGTAQLLLDGLDELNSSEGVDFQKRLKELWHKYPDIQIVVTSRQSPIIKGIAGFNQLYLHPLEEEQVDCLLDKLSALESDNTAKADILSFFDSTTGYVKKDGFIATNPMLLTVIARNHNELKDSIDSRARFYEVLYNELIRGHDEEKEAFKRLFHSVSDDILARFTSYVNVRMGNPSHFEEYVDRKRQGNTYDIEHILPDKYEDYKDSFTDYEDFEETRNQIGNLILLTRDKNRSYQAMNYSDKVQKYAGDNVLAQALNDNAYHNNPKFLEVANEYGMHSIPVFDKTSISDRAEIYMKMASDIWNADDIKKLAGGWSDEEEKQLFKNVKGREFTVGYANRSWADALKYGFLSANLGGSGKSIYNVQVGDTVFCHVAGSGFVGIGECTSTAVSMKNFMVQVDGVPTPISDAPWLSEDSKKQLDPNKEVFIGVTWKKYVTDPADGYWEKGMTSVPLVAYMLSDKTTHDKVREHFGYQDEG